MHPTALARGMAIANQRLIKNVTRLVEKLDLPERVTEPYLKLLREPGVRDANVRQLIQLQALVEITEIALDPEKALADFEAKERAVRLRGLASLSEAVSEKALAALAAAGYESPEQLDSVPDDALLAVEGVGKKALADLRAALGERFPAHKLPAEPSAPPGEDAAAEAGDGEALADQGEEPDAEDMIRDLVDED